MSVSHLLLEAWDGRCAYCRRAIAHNRPNKHPELATEDHFVPRRRKGPDTLANILPACSRCNSIKADIDPRYFLMLWLRLDPVGFFRTVVTVLRFERRKRVRPTLLSILYQQTPANEP